MRLRLVRRLLPVVPFVGLPLLGLAVLLGGGGVERHLRGMVSRELARSLQREVSVGEVRLRPGRIEIREVSVASTAAPGAKEERLLAVPEVKVEMSLRLSLHPLGPETIRRVTLVRPKLRLVRRADGAWEVEDLLRGKGAARFGGEVIIQEGQLEVEDRGAVALLPEARRISAAGIAAEVIFLEPGRGVFSLAATHGGPEFRRLRARGDFDSAKRRATVSGEIEGIDLAAAGSVLSREGMRVRDGEANLSLSADVSFATAGRPRFDYCASLEAHGVNLDLARDGWRQQVAQVGGEALVAADMVELVAARGELKGATIEATGHVRLGKQPRLELLVSGERLPIAEVRKLLPSVKLPTGLDLGERAGGKALVWGRAASPVVIGELELPRLVYRGAKLSDVAGEFAYYDKSVSFSGLRGSNGEESVGGRAWVAWGGGPARVGYAAECQGVRLGELASVFGQRELRGEGRVRAELRGGFDQRGHQAVARAESGPGRVERFAFDAARGLVGLKGRELRVAAAHVAAPSGAYDAEGEVSLSGKLDLRVLASRLDLEKVGEMAGVPELRGQAFCAARVTGERASPQVAGRLEALAGQAWAFPFDIFSAEFTASKKEVEISRVYAQRGSGAFRGEAALTDLDLERREGRLSGEVQIAHGRLEDIFLGGVRGLSLRGLIDGEARFGGRVSNPEMTGRLEARLPQVGEQQFDQAEADFSYRDHALEVKDFSASLAGSRIAGSGSYQRGGLVDFTVSSPGFELSHLDFAALSRLGLSPAGELSFSGRVWGPADSPEAHFEASGPRLSVNGEGIEDFQARGGWRRGLKLEELSLRQGEGRLRLTGEGGGEEGALRAELVMEGLEAGVVEAIVRRAVSASNQPEARPWQAKLAKLPAPMAGRVSGRVSVSGSEREPVITSSFEASGASIAQYRVPALSGEMVYRPGRLEVNRFSAVEGEANASVRGSVDFEGEAALDVEVHNLDLSVLRPWLRVQRRLAGKGDIYATVTGAARSPRVEGDLELVEPGYGDVDLERLRVGKFLYAGNRLELDRVDLVKGPHEAALAGSLPLAFSPLGVPEEEPMSVRFDMAGGDLSALEAFFPRVVAKAGGRLEASYEQSGTRAHPRRRGELVIEGGELQFTGDPNKFSLEVAARLEGDRLVLGGLPSSPEEGGARPGITIGSGEGTLTASGEGRIEEWDWQSFDRNRLDLVIAARKFGVILGDLLHGELNADLVTRRDEQSGRLVIAAAGEGKGITVANARIRPPLGRRVVLGRPRFAFNPGLDIPVSLGPNVSLVTPGGDFVLLGTGQIGGRLSYDDLVLVGNIHSSRGSVRFPAAPLQLTRGLATILKEAGGDPRITLYAEMTGRVENYRITLAASGAVFPQNSLRVTATSIPYLGEREVYALLAGATTFAGGPGLFPENPRVALGQQFGEILTTGLSGYGFGLLEQKLSAAFGLEELSVHFGVGGVSQVRIGERLGKKFLLSYASGFAPQEPTRVTRLSYEVTPTVFLGWSTDEQNRSGADVETFWRF